MRQSRRFVSAAALALALLPPFAKAQQLILEADSGVTAVSNCDMVHSLLSCDLVHISSQASLTVGAFFEIDGRVYVVDWMGPGYYLETGVILEPTGPSVADLKGQTWTEVYPESGKPHSSVAWRDTDANRILSASDTLTLDDSDRELRVKDVRLHMRVTPVRRKEKD
jgi:hypothetical protein